VVFPKDNEARVEDLDALAKRVGLTEALVNPGRKLELSRATSLRSAAVEAAKRHMSQKRSDRAARLTPVLKEGQQKLKEWSKRKLAEIDAREAAATSDGKKLRSDVAQRLGERRREVEHQLAQRRAWLTETMSTLDRPYLRIAAVLLGEGAAGKGTKR
jgi:hypothetical protein